MVKVGKASIFPIDVEEVIHAIPELTGEYQIILKKPGIQEFLEVRAECQSGVADFEALQERLKNELEKNINVKSKVKLILYGEFPLPTQFKAQHVVRDY